ncbi:MAG: hypothetical protein H0T05_00805 [Acidobacteria bacterium]|nr:hypothetical protein [Acidobacteriota bacterium]MBA3885510.1 hypothetical protein [Acidobacteriota bacterium]
MRTRVAPSVICLAFVLFTAPAYAQYGVSRAPDRATGERYHFEISTNFWNPTPDLIISSEALGIPGSDIDFVQDLGIEQSRFRQFRAVLRPATKHKFRFEYTPISYNAVSNLSRTIIFNGIAYPVTLPVDTSLDWKAYRFGYEWDFIYRDRGFLGLVLEAKYTDVQATLENVIDTQFVHARAPIPAIGIIGRGYIMPNVSITGEFSGFKLPEGISDDYRARYFDFDIYTTINFTNNVGVQGGYRSFDVFYRVDDDQGALVLKGLYFGGVVRF